MSTNLLTGLGHAFDSCVDAVTICSLENPTASTQACFCLSPPYQVGVKGREGWKYV